MKEFRSLKSRAGAVAHAEHKLRDLREAHERVIRALTLFEETLPAVATDVASGAAAMPDAAALIGGHLAEARRSLQELASRYDRTTRAVLDAGRRA